MASEVLEHWQVATGEMETQVLEHWQPVLPMPFRIIDELLTELIDSTLLQAGLVEAEEARLLQLASTADEETGYVQVWAEHYLSTPAALGDLTQALVLQLCDGVMVVASMSDVGRLWLWEEGREPQELLALPPGVAPRSIAAVPAGTMGAGSIADGCETRRLCLVAETGTAGPGGEAINTTAYVHVLDVTPPPETPAPWLVTLQAEVSAVTPHAPSARVSDDGDLLACPADEQTLHVYILPAAANPRRAGGAGGKTPETAPIPGGGGPAAAAAPPARLAYTVAFPSGAAPRLSFLLSPRARALADPLRWRAAGLMLWSSASPPQLTQLVFPSGQSTTFAPKDQPPPPIDLEPHSIRWRLLHPVTASASGGNTAWFVTGHRDGSVVAWDTSLRTAKYSLQRHAAAVTHLAFFKGAMLLSLAADGSLHCYDLSKDAETGRGKLSFRRRLPCPIGGYTWIGWARSLPLAFVASETGARVFDHNGELLARLGPPPGTSIRLGPPPGLLRRPGMPAAPGFAPGAARTILAFGEGAPAEPSSAAPPAGHETDATHGGETERGRETPGSELGRGSGALLSFSVSDILVAAYPNLADDRITAAALPAVLTRLTHSQRSDPAAVSALLFPPKMGTAASGRRTGSRGAGPPRTTNSRGSGVRAGGSASGPAGCLSADALSEQSARNYSGASRATFARSVAAGSVFSGASRPGPESIAGDSTAGHSIAAGSAAAGSCAFGGGQSICSHSGVSHSAVSGISGGSVASGASSTGSGWSTTTGLFIDETAQVQRAMRQRLHGRFVRESRTHRRLEELKMLAGKMQA